VLDPTLHLQPVAAVLLAPRMGRSATWRLTYSVIGTLCPRKDSRRRALEHL